MKSFSITALVALALTVSAGQAFACNEQIADGGQTAGAMSSYVGAPAVESSAVVFRITDNGKFRLAATLNEAAEEDCFVYLYARVGYGDNVSIIRRIKRKTLSAGQTRVWFTARHLPGVQQNRGETPIVNFATVTTCGDSTTIQSDPFARYMDCGYGTRKVTFKRWLATLKEKL